MVRGESQTTLHAAFAAWAEHTRTTRQRHRMRRASLLAVAEQDSLFLRGCFAGWRGAAGALQRERLAAEAEVERLATAAKPLHAEADRWWAEGDRGEKAQKA